MSLAEMMPAARSDAVRWTVSFVIVAILHVTAAVALIYKFAEPVNEYGIDAPAVMLDLPDAVPSMAPPQDLPPGPMEEEEADATPKPKEETKPAEAEAEVALPKPEPPKPEPPQEEKHRTAPVPAKMPPPSVVRWASKLSVHIQRYLRYPEAARPKEGTAWVACTIDRAGHVLHSNIRESTGSAMLDQEALTTVARAQPLPRPPDETRDVDLQLVIPVHFNTR